MAQDRSSPTHDASTRGGGAGTLILLLTPTAIHDAGQKKTLFDRSSLKIMSKRFRERKKIALEGRMFLLSCEDTRSGAQTWSATRRKFNPRYYSCSDHHLGFMQLVLRYLCRSSTGSKQVYPIAKDRAARTYLSYGATAPPG